MSHARSILCKTRLYFGGSVLKNYQYLRKNQWLDLEQTRFLQKERIKLLLLHAYHHVPYYKAILKNAGILTKTNNVDFDNYKKIPLLDKTIIRTRFEDLKSDDLASRKWYRNATGGSTGDPVEFIQDKEYLDWVIAIKMLYDEWSGYIIADPKILLWGSERDLLVGRETFKAYLGRWMRNEVWFNAFRMSPERMYEFVSRINVFKPAQILAYTGSIFELARFIERESLKIYSPKAIMVSANTLHEFMREKITKVFKAPVFNRYGSREVGDMACECGHNAGLHISPLTHYVEILRPDGTCATQGEMGEIVVTSLTNYTMPLLRYRIGDMGVWSGNNCSCGRNWPLMKEVKGKVNDIFVSRNGTLIDGGYFEFLFYDLDWVEKYQVVQEDYDCIKVTIVPRRRNDEPRESHSKELRVITDHIRAAMGRDCRVDYDYVADIAPSPSGKYRFTMSKIVR